MQRFEHTWRELFQSAPPDITWSDVIAQLIQRNRLSNAAAAVKIVAAAGRQGARAPVLFASAKPYATRPVLSSQPGLRLRVYPHTRHMHLASHKTLNHLFYKLAGDWAKREGGDEALILNTDGSVSETNTANVCCIVGDTACSPISQHALPGTMASEVRRLLSLWGFKIEDRRLMVEDVLGADQVFLTNSLMGAVSAVSLHGKELRYDSALCERINEVVFHQRDVGAAAVSA